MFSSWQSAMGTLTGARIADLYAGSGAVGLEALSRGAGHVLLVENDRKAVEVIKSNITTVGLAGAHLRAGDVVRTVQSAPTSPYDLIFLDPPYELDSLVLEGILVDVVEHGWLAHNAMVVIERAARNTGLIWPDGFVVSDPRTYGDTSLVTGFWYGHDT